MAPPFTAAAPIHNNHRTTTRPITITPTQHETLTQPTHVDYTDDTIHLGVSALTVDLAAAFDRVTRTALHNLANPQMQAHNTYTTSEPLD